MGTKLKAVGTNIFAGLFTEGIKRAGYDVLAHLEHGPYGVATAKLNFPKLDIRVGRENWNDKSFKGVDLIYGNPPCAAFSLAASGRRGSWDTQHDRLRYIYDCVELAVNAQPRAFMMESVTQAWTRGHSFITEQAERLCDAGFHVTVLLQNNKFLGTPQHRPRVFLIGHKHPLVWPKMTEPQTVLEALKGAKRLKENPGPKPLVITPKLAKLWKLRGEEGGSLHGIDEVHMVPGAKVSFLFTRLRANQPASVMIKYEARLHPKEPRYLHWHEWLALTGLPPTWKSAEPQMGPACAELARAVMPAVGKWMGKAVADGLKLPKLRGQPTARVVDMRNGPDAVIETPLFTFEGFTRKLTVPPPIPPYVPKEARAPRASSGPRAPGSTRRGSGERTRELILEGKLDTAGILAVIHKEFPGSKAGPSDVSWNRAKLRKLGKVA